MDLSELTKRGYQTKINPPLWSLMSRHDRDTIAEGMFRVEFRPNHAPETLIRAAGSDPRINEVGLAIVDNVTYGDLYDWAATPSVQRVHSAIRARVNSTPSQNVPTR